MKKFDPREYRHKKRVYVRVPRANLITRLFCWDREKKEYRAPLMGKLYYARRYELSASNERYLKGQYFDNLDHARTWQQQNRDEILCKNPLPKSLELGALPQKINPTFGQIYEEWKGRRFSALSAGTQRNYERYIRLHFQELISVPIKDITPRLIDEWIDAKKASVSQSPNAQQRIAFKHELSILRVILKYFAEYYDDVDFRMPLKNRHNDAIRVKRRGESKPKDLAEDEFWRFHKELLKQKHGRLFATLATVQYFQALRICEAAALKWEDVYIDRSCPSNSRLRISQHLDFPRIAGGIPVIVPGLKNDKGKCNEAVKEQPLFPEAFRALTGYQDIGRRGQVFMPEQNKLLTYRQVQQAYDQAFIAAKLPYRGTHVLRHGGTRRVYNETGDLAVAQQLLGNSDLNSTLVYAKRQKDALSKLAVQHWGRWSGRANRMGEVVL